MVLGGVVAPSARAAFDEFADGYSPKHFELAAQDMHLTLKGEVELELHDLQGRGGPGYDSVTDTRTLGTRSPFVEIDTFWLAPRLTFQNGLAVYSILEFTQRGAGVTAVWFDGRARLPQVLEHHLEVGFHTPFVKIDRRTERYPLIATAYWREPEVHVVYEGRWLLDESQPGPVALELGLSAAFMRPLAFASVQDASSHKGTLNIVGYGAARPFSGNAPVWGAKLHAEAYGAYATAFGYIGKLASEGGTDDLRNNFGNYAELPGADADALDRTFHWFGGRVGYDGHGLHAVVEAIASQESLLRRWGAYAQASYEVHVFEDTSMFHTVEPVLRYEVYRILDSTVVGTGGQALRSPAPSQAVTWDHDVFTAGLVLVVYRSIVRVRVEYAVLWEKNGVPALGLPDEPIRNNELLVQLEVRF
ncbi:MAG: hypothetical protein KC933_31445 [Myxococcales bacterium]|nr:hypothetical protein [Myxococcales bacterium]